ncbi:MAG: DMT family transporter [Anaerolineae bacterium]|nr:DMT family transporter [Anaerolineae bacterium]MBT7070440.1 DMT family transporter [Anaerolineae bacterium]MBT7990631.1 DMT family transporter [Anaerolineae bacterium]
MGAYLGELAALATSLTFSVGSTMFTAAGRRIGSIIVNRTRLVIAAVFLSIVHWLTLGTILPFDASPERWLWLGLSGVVGLVLGDIFLFQAFVLVGPRLSMLMMSLAPILAALQAWIFLGESLTGGQIFGITLTLAGIAWVVMEGNSHHEGDREYGRGILLGLGGAIGQATGLVLAKNGLGGEFSPISANLIRMLAAIVVLWGITFFQGQAKATIQALRNDSKGALFTAAGAFLGPFIGVSLSLFAIQRVEVGVASTLTSLPPVFLLPISYFVFKERFGWGAIAGTFLAMAGVAALFLV